MRFGCSSSLARSPRRLVWAALPAALLFGFFALRTPEPARTAFALLAGVCDDDSPRARARLLETHVAQSLVLEVEDDEHGWSKRGWTHEEVGEQLAEIRMRHPRCQLALEVTGVHGAEGSERLEGELQFSASQAGDLHAEWRSVVALFATVGGQRQLQRVQLFAPERSLPEARP